MGKYIEEGSFRTTREGKNQKEIKYRKLKNK
jgi:hypothetical protein